MDGKGEGGGTFPHLFPFLSLAAFLCRDGQRIWRKWEEQLAAHLRFSQECCCAEMFFFLSPSLPPVFSTSPLVRLAGEQRGKVPGASWWRGMLGKPGRGGYLSACARWGWVGGRVCVCVDRSVCVRIPQE